MNICRSKNITFDALINAYEYIMKERKYFNDFI